MHSIIFHVNGLSPLRTLSCYRTSVRLSVIKIQLLHSLSFTNRKSTVSKIFFRKSNGFPLMSHDLCVSRCMPLVCLAQPIIPLIHLILDSQTRALNGRWILGQIRTLHLDAILSTFSREECIMLQQERTQNKRRGVPPGLPWLFFSN